MTTPYERTRAVLETRKFLSDLTCPDRTPDVPGDIRHWAEALLRHYPDAGDIRLAALGLANWFSVPPK
jgi:hypothetical protein